MRLRRQAAALALAMLVVAAGESRAQTLNTDPKLPGTVRVTQKIGGALPLERTFRDESGRIVRLGDFFKSGRPVLLNFVYYSCPMLCGVVLEGTTNALTELKLDVGKDFDVVTVSIDPRDTPDIAAEKKEKYVKRYGRPSAYEGWHFLTGPDMSIKPLADAVGFEYAYDPKSNQFAHGALLVALTPDGKISRYLYGFEYKPRDLRLALVEASAGKIGTATDQILLLCFHYDPATGKYTKTAMNFVRAGGVATVAGLAGFIFVMIRTERRRTAGSIEENDQQ